MHGEAEKGTSAFYVGLLCKFKWDGEITGFYMLICMQSLQLPAQQRYIDFLYEGMSLQIMLHHER